MNPANLPKSQLVALEQVQNALQQDVVKAATSMNRRLAARVKTLTEKLRKAKWNKAKIRAEIKQVLDELGGDVQKQVIRLIDDAAQYADKYQRRLLQYRVEQKEPLKPSEIKWAREGRGKGPARAAVAYARGRAAGDKGKLFAKSGKLGLSKKLHRMTDFEIEEVTGRVLASIKEAQGLEFASRELVDAATNGLGKGESYPRLIRKVEKKAKGLEKIIGAEDFEPEMEQIKRYMRRLKGGIRDFKHAKEIGVPLKEGVPFVRAGRMQAAYQELVSDLADGKAAEKAINKWAYQKQRYRADMIVHSETTAAFRQRQIQNDEGKDWIIGYTVRLNRGFHTRWKASKPGKLKALGGKSCLCEVYDGQTISIEDYKTKWYRGFHPW